MYRLSKIVLLSMLCAPLSGCCIFGTTDDEPAELVVVGHKEPYRDGNYPALELRITSRGGEALNPPMRVSDRHYIQGFKFEWGYEHRLMTTRQRRNLDGYVTHRLDKILEKRSVAGQTFELEPMGAPWLAAGEAPRALMDGTSFACGPGACEALDARLKEGPKARFKMTLRHEASGAPLTLLGVE